MDRRCENAQGNHGISVYLRCQTPNRRRPGCAYLDTSVIYVDQGDVILQEAERSPANDIYLRIPHALMDPVLDSAQHRLMAFFSTTFWCNVEVFQCQQAGPSNHPPWCVAPMLKVQMCNSCNRKLISPCKCSAQTKCSEAV